MLKLIIAFIVTAGLVAGSKLSVIKTVGISAAVSAAAILLLSFFVLLF